MRTQRLCVRFRFLFLVFVLHIVRAKYGSSSGDLPLPIASDWGTDALACRLPQRRRLQFVQLYNVRSPDSQSILPHRWQGTGGRGGQLLRSGTYGDEQFVGSNM
jgi:hypothetical protein